jgi:hypothetical protein
MDSYTQTLLVEENPEEDHDVWGRLVSLNPNFPSLALKENENVFGRSSASTFRFEDKRISGQHCKITRIPDSKKLTGGAAAFDVYLVEDFRSGFASPQWPARCFTHFCAM